MGNPINMIQEKRLYTKLCVSLSILIQISLFGLSGLSEEKYTTILSEDTGIVFVVYDGDTIKVRLDDGKVHKARLIGIDAPEIEDEREDVQFLAYTAKRFAFFHLYRKRVKLTYDWERSDKYGRILVYVWSEEVGLFNEFILREGYASVFTKFPFREEYRKRFVAAEKQARNLEKGFWKREPLLSISEKDVYHHVGEFLSVKFLCSDFRSSENFLFLNSSGDFSAILPRENLTLFPPSHTLKGRILSVKGFLETYKGKPQIMVFLPLQLNIIE